MKTKDEVMEELQLSPEEIQDVISVGVIKYSHLGIPQRRQAIDTDISRAAVQKVLANPKIAVIADDQSFPKDYPCDNCELRDLQFCHGTCLEQTIYSAWRDLKDNHNWVKVKNEEAVLNEVNKEFEKIKFDTTY